MSARRLRVRSSSRKWTRACRLFFACSHVTLSNKRVTARASKAATKDSKRGSRPSKCHASRASYVAEIPNRRLPETRGASNVSLLTTSREFALQMLFQWDMSPHEPAQLEANFWRAAKEADSTRAFANRLFEGTAKDVSALDELIVKHAENWGFERLAAIDRAGLRLASYEIRGGDTPFQGVLHQAVDLA